MSYKISYEQKGVRLFLSASRRTDIVAIYCDWLFNRLKEGYVLVRNPHYYHQVGKINLSNKLIDCIIFWTKNPEKIYNRLEELKDYNYYFQITINNYGKEFEPVIPSIDKIINLVEKLSSKIGPKRIVWRYDPIVLTKEFDLKFHIQNFEVLASKLKNNINKCVFSFLDVYLQTEENLKKYGLIIIDELKMKEIAKKLSEVAQKYNIRLETCCEKIDLSDFSISHGKCIDDKLISDIIGIDLNISKDKFQRKYCGCAESIDIGTYNTCSNVCLYCYANYNKGILRNNLNNHNPKSPLLIGDIETDDKISERKMKSYLNLKQVEFKEQKCF